jgi:formylglycine-generating enzyme required for sulfatase activity
LAPFCFGASVCSRQANFDGSRPYGTASRGPNLRRTTPVGLYRQRNAFGLEEMYGNVWEWCADRFKEVFYRDSPTIDPRGPEQGDRHVLRGGSWYFYGMVLRAAFRGNGDQGYTQNFVGLRVVCEPLTSPQR